MAATNIGALLVAAALLAKSGLFGDLLPGATPPNNDNGFGLDESCPHGWVWSKSQNKCIRI